MKCLSERQPWGFLLCAGIKNIENRTWPLPEKYKGETILIHASAKWDGRHRNMSQLFTPDQWRSLSDDMQKIMVGGILPTSAIIGSLRFVDCVINHPSIWAEKTPDLITETDKNGLDWRLVSRKSYIYNWVATGAVLFDKPILNVKGRLGLWDYPMTEEEYLNLVKIGS